MARVTIEKAVPVNRVLQSPDGKVHTSRERALGWQANFRKLKAAGYNHPAPWAHQKDAKPLPGDDAYWKSKYNAGYVEDLLVDDEGNVGFVLDLPGLAHDKASNAVIDPQLKTAIKEVSAGIFPEFTDGKGNKYVDVIGHVALTPWPVVADQPGFKELAKFPEKGGGITCLSLDPASISAVRLAKDDEGDPAGNKPPFGGPPDKKAGGKPPGDKPPEKPSNGNGGVGHIRTGLLEKLAGRGIVLPADTDRGNFEERLDVAITALRGKLEPTEPAQGNNPNPGNNSGGYKEEAPTPSVMMALKTSNPELHAYVERQQARERKQLEDATAADRAAAAELRGKLVSRVGKAAVDGAFPEAGLGQIRLSVAADGSIAPSALLAEMRRFERATAHLPDMTKLAAGGYVPPEVREEKNPVDLSTADRARAADEVAKKLTTRGPRSADREKAGKK